MTKVFHIGLCGLIFAASGCAHKLHFKPSRDDRLLVKKIISMRGDDLIDKNDQWKLQAQIKNLYEGSVILFFSEMECFRGKQAGTLVQEYYANDTLYLKRGQTKRVAFICRFDPPVESTEPYHIKFQRVFLNPLDDGETTEKVIAKNVVWKIQQGQAIY